MKTCNFILIFILCFSLSGCASNEPYVAYSVKDVNIAIKAKRPKIECSLDTENDMFDCIVLQKRIIEELTE